MHFEWTLGGHPPHIEPASRAKLSVFSGYLHDYFDRLNAGPYRDEFKIDLVDGFSGGGTFRDNLETISGTPLIMLEETKSAIARLNLKRTKPLRFKCKFHFVDKNKEHTDHLRRVLAERGYKVDGDNIAVYTSSFREVAGRIIEDVARRQPRVGRAIFLLDQTGYAQVEFELIAKIFQRLLAAEVILTFAADALVNYLAETPKVFKAVSPIQLPESKIQDLIRYRDGDGGRALIQRLLRNHTRLHTGAQFDTPFFIRPRQSRRALWFLHLSQHPTARDVMIQRHWATSNTFEHYGPGDFGMLGWDTLRESATLPLFRFGSSEQEALYGQLINSLPREISHLASEGPVSVGAFRQAVANRTTARFSDLDKVVLDLAKGREIEILTNDGRARSRKLARLRPSDVIAFPRTTTLMFPGFSRFGG